MIHSSIHTVQYPDGSFQRFQRVRPGRWEELFFTQPVSIPGAYHQVLQLYQEYLIPRYRPFLKTCLLFRIPDSMKQNEPVKYRNTVYFQTEAYMATRLRDAVHYRRSFLSVDSPEAQQLYAQLNDSGCLGIASGKLPGVSILPVGDTFGFLSETSASLAVNASFFIMNPPDVTSPFDSIGTSFGLAVQNGTVLYPPLFER